MNVLERAGELVNLDVKPLGKIGVIGHRIHGDWRLRAHSPLDAILYSVDSMSTRGASGLTLQGHWRMMGALEVVDGMLLFGISTAYIFSLMQAYWPLFSRRH
jgi:hypothetical protein